MIYIRLRRITLHTEIVKRLNKNEI
jgi:hypothetical protein